MKDSTAIMKVVDAVIYGHYKSAAVYISEDRVAKCTAPRKVRMNEWSNTVVLTLGKPNYAEREFIKKCKAAGEPFPVKKIQLKDWPAKKAKKKARR